MYPILNLRHYKMDLHWYLRSLEEVVIRALRSACAMEATRIEGITGVWVGKLATCLSLFPLEIFSYNLK